MLIHINEKKGPGNQFRNSFKSEMTKILKIIIFLGFLYADDGHNEDCKDIEVGKKCELDCEAVNKEKLKRFKLNCPSILF